VVFISENTKRYFGSVRFSRPPMIIFNGVDCGIFRPLGITESRDEIRGRLGLPQNQPVALFVGRFVPKKGLGVMREMAAREPHITWAFAGTGALDPAAWGLGNVKVFSTLREHSLAELYRASDVFVLPSTGEGFPLVLQEALASGIPVVCGAESAGADQAVTAFFRGIELAPGNDQLSGERFLAAIHEVLRAATRSGLAQQQHEFARSRYSWQLALRRYSELFTGLAHTPAIVSTGAPAKVRSAFAGANGTPQGGV
jgi:glycosyltransferase involved in cell wall biosynthesis